MTIKPEDTKVFVIDDEPANLDIYRRALTHYQVRAFANPREALKATLDENPTCLVVDYRMPELTGIELVKECRAEGYDGTVLMVTAFGELDEIVYAEQVHLIYRILPKPVRVDYLREQVDLVVAESRFRTNLEGRRRFPRIRVPLVLEAQLDRQWAPVDAQNVSLGGVLLSNDPRLREGDQIPLRLRVENETLDGVGKIVHVGDQGAGVEFVNMTQEFRHAVGQLILRHRYHLDDRRKNTP